MDKSVGEIAELVNGSVIGDCTSRITGVNGIKQAAAGDLSFVAGSRYLQYLESSGATAVLVTPNVSSSTKTLIQVENPYHAFVRVLQACATENAPRCPAGVHESAAIGRNVTLGDGVAIDAFVRIADDCTIGDRAVLYAGVYVGQGATIGADTVVYPNAVIREGVRVGARCILHAGVVLGTDGFGFAPVNGTWFKIPQVGNVVIGDDVEIGTNTAVDRATFGNTVVGRGTKIDNLVQIAHNVELGEHCVISGMTGIAGSTTIGRNVTIAAQVGIADHVEVGDGATIAGRSGVATPVKPGAIVSGYPAMDHQAELRILANLRRLPETVRKVKELERRIHELEEQLHGKAEDNR